MEDKFVKAASKLADTLMPSLPGEIYIGRVGLSAGIIFLSSNDQARRWLENHRDHGKVWKMRVESASRMRLIPATDSRLVEDDSSPEDLSVKSVICQHCPEALFLSPSGWLDKSHRKTCPGSAVPIAVRMAGQVA